MERQDDPPVFTPDNEPYLGRESVYVLDTVISNTVPVNARMGELSRRHSPTLTPLQQAACDIIPQGISIALSIRELVRQGYLFGAACLLRSLMERAAIISYLDENPEAVELWRDGWKHGERPGLKKMVQQMEPADVDEGVSEVLVETLNHLTHGDPVGAGFNVIELPGGSLGYSMGKTTDSPRLCDFICEQTLSWLLVLTARANSIMGSLQSEE